MPSPSPRPPGIQVDLVEAPAPAGRLRTGVPAFLAYAPLGPAPRPATLTRAEQLLLTEKSAELNPYLASAVRGFFDNGGEQCQVVWLDTGEALDLEAAFWGVEDIDLICAPGAVPPFAGAPVDLARLQAAILELCAERGDCFAILDSPPGVYESTDPGDDPLDGHRRAILEGLDAPTRGLGALYYPWLRLPGDPPARVPPCGHVAGIYARADRRTGVFRAPANEEIEGAVDLERDLLDPAALNERGINGLRASPGRGIRVMGARTLSEEPAWRYINVRRLFLTTGRWLARAMNRIAFEPHDLRLWLRLRRELGAYLEELYRQGALKGATPAEAFYVKCDEETNPPEQRDQGRLTVEVGLAPAAPCEFITLRLVHAGGVTAVQPG